MTLRRYGVKAQATMPLEVFELALMNTIAKRTLAFEMS